MIIKLMDQYRYNSHDLLQGSDTTVVKHNPAAIAPAISTRCEHNYLVITHTTAYLVPR